MTQCSRFISFPWIASARSFVMIPSLSITSTHDASRLRQNAASASFSSSFARCCSPRVHAKMDATGFVDVSRPFWCSRKWRVTVPTIHKIPSINAKRKGYVLRRLTVRGLRLDGLAIRRYEFTSHHSEATETLRKDVRLHIAIVVLASPNEAA